jgi:uncharacterized protein (TIGR02246 family)
MSREANPPNDELQIRELIASWAAAVRREDLEGIRAHHDDDILMFDVPPPFRSRGLAAYMDTWSTFYKAMARPVAFDFRDVEVTAGTDVAFATAIGSCNHTERSGEVIKLEFRLTMGLRKQDGRWRVLHEHHSLPAVD